MKDYPLVKFVISFLVGILLHRIFNIDIWQILILLFIITLSTYLIKKYFSSKLKDSITQLLFVPVFVLAGLLIASYHHKEFTSPLSKFYKEKNSKLYAEVKSIELLRSYEVVFNVNIDSIFIDNKKINCNDELICKFRGDTLQRSQFYANINPGNKIFLSGTFQKGREQRNPYEFDYNQYLNSKNVAGIFLAYDTDSIAIINNAKNHLSSLLFNLKKSIDDIIVNLHNKETADLLRGLILADRSGIDFETKNAFVNSGVVHILAVSGLNVGYVMLIFILMFGRFSIYVRSVLTVIGLIIFMFLTGATPPVVRATVMGVIFILTFLTNRSSNIYNSLAISAFVILFFFPQQIYDPGFQLSFGAVLSTAIIYPYIESWIKNLNIKWKWINKTFLFMAVSFSAQIGTIPFTLIYFSKLSVISIIANLFVIPISGIITAIAFITIFLGSLWSGFAIYFAAANELLSLLMMEFIRYTGNFEFSFMWIRNYSLYDSIIFYLSLISFLYFIRLINKTIIKFLFAILMFILIINFSSFDDKTLLDDNKLNVMMIDVGQGDAFLIKFPNGKTALIDAGEANPYLDNGERIIMPLMDNLGIEKIDYGFISHLDLDHYGGFVSLIYNGRIREVYRPLPDSSSKSLRLERFLKQKKVKTFFYDKSILKIGNVNIYILNNPNNFVYKSLSSNDKSGILKIVFGKTSFLFVGDCEYHGEYLLANTFGDILQSNVLKVGHHGSPTASSETFLNLVNPKISLISAGIKNKFNHPAQSVLESLKKIHSEILRTDSSGAILLQSNGKNIKQINWKNI